MLGRGNVLLALIRRCWLKAVSVTLSTQPRSRYTAEASGHPCLHGVAEAAEPCDRRCALVCHIFRCHLLRLS